MRSQTGTQISARLDTWLYIRNQCLTGKYGAKLREAIRRKTGAETLDEQASALMKMYRHHRLKHIDRMLRPFNFDRY